MIKLRKTIYSVIYLLTGIFTLSGCIERYEADIAAEDSKLLVVEGTICSSKESKFVLSRSQSIGSYDVPRMVTDAAVSVRGSDGSKYEAKFVGGYYSCKTGALSPDVEYALHIEADGEVYESDPQKPIRTEEIEAVIGVQDTPESDIDVLITPAVPFNPDQVNYYSWTYDETWEVRPECTTSVYFDTQRKEPVVKHDLFPERGWKDATGEAILVGESQNYEGHHIQKLKLYDIGRNSYRLFYKYSGMIHQRAISKAEYEYELARRQASSEMGGLFTPQPSTLPTNIRCLTSGKHVIGYVGCSLNIAEYRFFFSPKDYSIVYPQLTDSRKWVEDITIEECCNMVNRGWFLCEWQDPQNSMNGKLRTAWALESQLDVRYNGAYIVKPDYWQD